MQDFLMESVKLQRIDFFTRLVAAGNCSEEEKLLAIQWISELTDELLAKIHPRGCPRTMNLPGVE